MLPATLIIATAALAVAATAPAAAAETPPVSQSRGFFLAGSVAGTDLGTVAELDDAAAVNRGGAAVTTANPLGATVLGQLAVPIGQQTVPIGSGLTFGALNQFAQAGPDGSATASSGAVADNGAVQTATAAGDAGNMSLDLQALAAGSGLPAGQLAALGDAKLTAGALAGRATRAPFGTGGALGAAGGSYQIGSLTLDITAGTALTGLLDSLTGAATDVRDAVQGAIDDATAALPVGGLLTVSATLPDPDALLASVTSVSGPGYEADLLAGTLSLDLVQIIESATGRDINALDPNTELLPLIVAALPDIAQAITAQLGTQLDAARDAFLASLGGLTVSVAGVVVPITAQPISEFLPGFADLTAPLGTAFDALGGALGTVLGQLGSALQTLVSLTANVQSTASDQTFTETALSLALLPSMGGAVPTALQLDLGNAAVGPGAPLVAATPTPTATPTVPMLANTGPVETLGSLAIGTWALVAGVAMLFATGAIMRSRSLHVGGHRS